MENRKKQGVNKGKKKTQQNNSKLLLLIVIIVLIIGAVFLVKYLKNTDSVGIEQSEIHEDVSLNEKENSYYELLLKATNDHKELVEGAEHVYFNVNDLPKLEYDEKVNIAKKVLHSFKIHKDKELLLDTFDGLFFREILNQETSELKDGIFITFEDLYMESNDLSKQFAISIYKNSNLNPTIVYDVKLDDDGKILSYNKVSDLMPHENVEKSEENESETQNIEKENEVVEE